MKRRLARVLQGTCESDQKQAGILHLHSWTHSGHQTYSRDITQITCDRLVQVLNHISLVDVLRLRLTYSRMHAILWIRLFSYTLGLVSYV
jgi:hypothetical protein